MTAILDEGVTFVIGKRLNRWEVGDMPLTFAHPAAILPFSRQSKYIHFSALVLGSMAPDFEYFLRGRPVGEIGHSFTGFLLLIYLS